MYICILYLFTFLDYYTSQLQRRIPGCHHQPLVRKHQQSGHDTAHEPGSTKLYGSFRGPCRVSTTRCLPATHRIPACRLPTPSRPRGLATPSSKRSTPKHSSPKRSSPVLTERWKQLLITLREQSIVRIYSLACALNHIAFYAYRATVTWNVFAAVPQATYRRLEIILMKRCSFKTDKWAGPDMFS